MIMRRCSLTLQNDQATNLRCPDCYALCAKEAACTQGGNHCSPNSLVCEYCTIATCEKGAGLTAAPEGVWCCDGAACQALHSAIGSAKSIANSDAVTPAASTKPIEVKEEEY